MKLIRLLATGTLLLLGFSGNAAQPAAVTFTVEPSFVGSCSPVVAKVTWNATAAGAHSVKIFVHENDDPEKLFSEGATEGSVNTGSWVRAKVVFRLTDGESGNQLATLTIEGKKC